jgi:hypothetical protein
LHPWLELAESRSQTYAGTGTLRYGAAVKHVTDNGSGWQSWRVVAKAEAEP